MSEHEWDGVVHDGSADPIEAAAMIAGMDKDDLEKYRGMSIEQLQEAIAEMEAKRIAKRVQ